MPSVTCLGALPIERFEAALLAMGGLLLVGTLISLKLRGRTAAAFRLPAPPIHVIAPTDLVLGWAAIFILPGFMKAVAAKLGAIVTSSDSDASPSAAELSWVAAGQVMAIGFLAWLGQTRFRGGLDGWGLNRRKLALRMSQAVLAYLLAWPLCAGTLQLTVAAIERWAPDYSISEHEAIQALLHAEPSIWVASLIIFSAVVLAAFAEEMFFRGLVQPALATWLRSPWAAVLLSAMMFGYFHFPLLHTIPALSVFGVALGYVYARTGSLTLAVLLHAIFNAKTLLWVELGAISSS
jgi:membrane protease YdiL (CAAX protease family)